MAQAAENLLDEDTSSSLPMAPSQQFLYPKQSALDAIAASQTANQAFLRTSLPSIPAMGHPPRDSMDDIVAAAIRDKFNTVARFAHGGLSEAFPNLGIPTVGDFLHSDAANAALGVVGGGGGTAGRRPVPSLSPGFSRFEAERGASGAARLSDPVRASPVGAMDRDAVIERYDRALAEGRLMPQEHQGFMQELGVPASAPGEAAVDASAREFLRGRLGFVPAGEPQAWARMHGWSGQPSEAEPAVGPLGGNAAARAAFTRHIAPHMEENDFADKYFAGMHNPYISMARLYGYGSRGEGISFDGPLRIGDRNVGQITRTIYPETGEVKHGYLALDSSLQGSDIGKKLLANQVAIYNRMGLKKVSLTANIDVGGYAWAKYGFIPDEDDWEELARNLRSRLNGMNVPSEVVQPLRQILRSDDPRSMWSLADVKAAGGIGKQLLLGQHWHGSLDLKDSASMKRFTDYVLPRPKPTQ